VRCAALAAATVSACANGTVVESGTGPASHPSPRPTPNPNPTVGPDHSPTPEPVDSPTTTVTFTPPTSPSVPGYTRTRTFTAARLSPESPAVPPAPHPRSWACSFRSMAGLLSSPTTPNPDTSMNLRAGASQDGSMISIVSEVTRTAPRSIRPGWSAAVQGRSASARRCSHPTATYPSTGCSRPVCRGRSSADPCPTTDGSSARTGRGTAPTSPR
jgi:hypothetical protein